MPALYLIGSCISASDFLFNHIIEKAPVNEGSFLIFNDVLPIQRERK